MMDKKKKKILIIHRAQFGYHITTYNYCKQMCFEFDIVYCGFDGRERLFEDGVEVKYISNEGNVIVRYFRLLYSLNSECRKDYDVVFIRHFIGCCILKFLQPTKKYILDIRTGSVSQNSLKRWWDDFLMRAESRFFRHVSVISKSLAVKLKLAEHKIHVLPLGAEPIDVPIKQFGSLNLLYVGTFSGRHIEDTVKGFAKFYLEYKDSVEVTYDIVGDGHNGELDELRQLVRQRGVSSVVRLPGYIHQSKLKNYYQKCNVGVSYVPINDIYNCQPPTKAYEYILAGMPVVATETKENTIVINRNNGVLVKDTAESFYEGLKNIVANKEQYRSSIIKQDALQYSWNRIVNNNFIPYINSIMKQN